MKQPLKCATDLLVDTLLFTVFLGVTCLLFLLALDFFFGRSTSGPHPLLASAKGAPAPITKERSRPQAPPDGRHCFGVWEAERHWPGWRLHLMHAGSYRADYCAGWGGAMVFEGKWSLERVKDGTLYVMITEYPVGQPESAAHYRVRVEDLSRLPAAPTD